MVHLMCTINPVWVKVERKKVANWKWWKLDFPFAHHLTWQIITDPLTQKPWALHFKGTNIVKWMLKMILFAVLCSMSISNLHTIIQWWLFMPELPHLCTASKKKMFVININNTFCILHAPAYISVRQSYANARKNTYFFWWNNVHFS